MTPEDRLTKHLAGRLGCDEGAFRQKKPLFIACGERDRPDWTGARSPAWILERKRARIVSVVPPLAPAFKNHHGAALAEADGFLPADLVGRIARDLEPFFGPVQARHRTWFLVPDGFEHVQEIEIVPLTVGDDGDLEDFAPGWWPRLRELSAARRVLGVRMDDRFVAFAAPFAESRTGAEIACLTHPDYRGIGIGRELVAAVAAQILAERRTPSFTTAHASPGAGRIAKALGFLEFAQDFVFEIA